MQVFNMEALVRGTNLPSSHHADCHEDQSFLFKGIRKND